uniref:G-protein coupled receptors family 2 profile 2 domain-containing protein n=1 Tax=Erpetoichthys calabaricus TaxID=27687 RepID=A0A8C4XAV9_ERPCA
MCSFWRVERGSHHQVANMMTLIMEILFVTGFVYRNCTSHGWSDSFPRHDVACGLNHNSTNSYFMNLKTVYTVGYSTSMVSLIIAIAILCFFKKLHCSRNFIHMQLFVSFVLRALSVLIKDRILFSSEDIYHCNEGCKFALFFFHYCIMANYSWLLIEGLYLHTLLVVSFFTAKKYFWWYISFGWGMLILCHMDKNKNCQCWENENLKIKWIIKGPIIITIFVSSINQKSKRVDIYLLLLLRRLAKSTLLLIPLFGMHYTVLAFIPGNVSSQVFYARVLYRFYVCHLYLYSIHETGITQLQKFPSSNETALDGTLVYQRAHSLTNIHRSQSEVTS